MNTISICNYIDIAHISMVESTIDNNPILKNGNSWLRIQAKAKITYQSTTENTDSGTLHHEIVTIQAETQYIDALLNNKQYYILRLYTNQGNFTLGSMQYPTIKIVTGDKMRKTIQFTATSQL